MNDTIKIVKFRAKEGFEPKICMLPCFGAVISPNAENGKEEREENE